jgi:hypothetical protein
MFDGPVALRNLAEGEVVGVLEESVGPKNRYHRARSFRDNVAVMEGWYPQEFLVKINEVGEA